MLVGECFCLRETFINVNKLFIVYFVHVRPRRIVVAIYPLFLYSTLLLLVYFYVRLFFILTLLLYFCLFVNHVYKPIIFAFGAFVHNFKNTISIFVTISLLFLSLVCFCFSITFFCHLIGLFQFYFSF